MVIIFDLDDTLYNEIDYVRGGLAAVARHGEGAFGWDRQESFRMMIEILEKRGRGKIFDHWLSAGNRYSKRAVSACVRVYRRHTPAIRLYREAEMVLTSFEDVPLYVVTDGNKIVQARKIDALGLAERFCRVYVTHRYGIRNAKPSTYCFELIRNRERCKWRDMVHVGDNPAKDFVSLNPLGVTTVRVLTGGYQSVKAKPGTSSQADESNI